MQYIKEQENRIETGVVQFGNDWPGLFIRGDNCAALVLLFELIQQQIPTEKNHPLMIDSPLKQFITLLKSTNLHNK